ncbi:MAG TPA: nuclear transport factor 2 family protein [Caulobacteraceae bacterium]|jgi:uncharacterized protein (TIGR02246 family)
MRRVALLAGLVAVSAVVGCAPAAKKPVFNAAKTIDALRADEVDWNADWKSGDPGKVVAHFAPDAVAMLPGEPPAAGLEAIRSQTQRAMDDPGFSLTFNSEKVIVATSGDLAAARGVFTLKATDPATKAVTTSSGAFVTVYKPQPDGAWRAIWDIATLGPTPAAPK